MNLNVQFCTSFLILQKRLPQAHSISNHEPLFYCCLHKLMKKLFLLTWRLYSLDSSKKRKLHTQTGRDTSLQMFFDIYWAIKQFKHTDPLPITTAWTKIGLLWSECLESPKSHVWKVKLGENVFSLCNINKPAISLTRIFQLGFKKLERKTDFYRIFIAPRISATLRKREQFKWQRTWPVCFSLSEWVYMVHKMAN